MRLTSLFIVLLQLEFLFAQVSPGENQLPTYRVFKTGVPIDVDGRLDDAPWQGAAEVGPFRNNTDGTTSPLNTYARVLYDDQYLYFSFRSFDSNIWSTMKQRDEHLWEEEVVEVFLQPDADHPSYIELEVNPLGTMLDIFLIDKRKPIPYESWNSSGLKWAVQVKGTVDGNPGDSEWTCEMALPLGEAITARRIPPQAGDTWRMNLFRGDRRPALAGLAWSPTLKGDFHIPARFGYLVFTGETVK